MSDLLAYLYLYEKRYKWENTLEYKLIYKNESLCILINMKQRTSNEMVISEKERKNRQPFMEVKAYLA